MLSKRVRKKCWSPTLSWRLICWGDAGKSWCEQGRGGVQAKITTTKNKSFACV